MVAEEFCPPILVEAKGLVREKEENTDTPTLHPNHHSMCIRIEKFVEKV